MKKFGFMYDSVFKFSHLFFSLLLVSDAANLKVKETKLPITANYLAYPPFPYMNSQQSNAHSAPPPPPPPPPPIAPNPYLFPNSDNG